MPQPRKTLDAELSRILAKAMDSPYWAFLANQENLTPTEVETGLTGRDKLNTRILQECLNAGTYNKLPIDIKKLFIDASTTYQIAQDNNLDVDFDLVDIMNIFFR